MTWLALQVSDVLFLGLGMIFGAVLLAVAWALVKGAFPRTKASEGGQPNASHRIQERLSEFNAQMTEFQQEVSGHRTTLEDARRRLQALQVRCNRTPP